MSEKLHAAGPRFGEFVGLVAGLLALGAVAIDAMLPALPAIGRSLGVTDPNARQWIVTAYILGNGIGQAFYGVLSDRFGRKPVLIGGIAGYLVLSALAAFASSLGILILLRFLHGVAAASSVTARSVLRDRYSGARMSRVMSLSYVVLLAVPVLAPSLGQAILAIADWRWIFGFFTIFGLVMLVWTGVRLPETLHPEYRRAISVAAVTSAIRMYFGNRSAFGYTLASGFLMAALVGFIGSVQQIFADSFGRPRLLSLMMGACAVWMAGFSLLNSQIVVRAGVRRMAHAALWGFIAVTTLHAAIALQGLETLWSFVALQSLTVGCFALAGSNFAAIAMEPMGAIAGLAASIQGVVATLGGSLLGAAIGQSFDGSTVPLAAGSVLCGLGALACVAFAERRLFSRPAP